MKTYKIFLCGFAGLLVLAGIGSVIEEDSVKYEEIKIEPSDSPEEWAVKRAVKACRGDRNCLLRASNNWIRHCALSKDGEQLTRLCLLLMSMNCIRVLKDSGRLVKDVCNLGQRYDRLGMVVE